MKMFKIFTLVLMSLFFLPTENSAMSCDTETETSVTTLADDVDKPTISIKLKWGRPKKDCKGFGICGLQIIIDISFNRVEGGGAGTGTINDEGRLQLDVMASSLTDESLGGQFEGNNFRVEEPLVLPAEVAAELEVESYTIQPGNYPVEEVETEHGPAKRIVF